MKTKRNHRTHMSIDRRRTCNWTARSTLKPWCKRNGCNPPKLKGKLGLWRPIGNYPWQRRWSEGQLLRVFVDGAGGTELASREREGNIYACVWPLLPLSSWKHDVYHVSYVAGIFAQDRPPSVLVTAGIIRAFHQKDALYEYHGLDFQKSSGWVTQS